jgi:hypothetical protein
MTTTTAGKPATSAVLGRLFWMMLGPFALAITAFSITERRDGWCSPLDGIYFVVLGGVFLGRWLEFRSGRPLTAAGEPATPAHLRRYALVLGLVGLGVWVVANLVGNRAIGLTG